MTVGLFSVVEKRAEEERRDRDWIVVMEERCVVIGGRVLCGCNMKELMAGAAESRKVIIILIVACIVLIACLGESITCRMNLDGRHVVVRFG